MTGFINVFIKDPVTARATIAKSQVEGPGIIRVIIGIADIPTPIITTASVYLSAIQSNTAPNRVSLPDLRATVPSIRSRTADMNRRMLPGRKALIA